jgi:hypothetical protein
MSLPYVNWNLRDGCERSFLTPEMVLVEIKILAASSEQVEKVVNGWKVVARDTGLVRKVIRKAFRFCKPRIAICW